jgi:hypothetical protein
MPACFPKAMLTDAEAQAKVVELAERLESFDPAALDHTCVFVPFIECSCSVSCSYDAERYVHDREALQAAHRRRDARYDAWAAKEEYWRSKNHFTEKYPDPDDHVKYEKDVSGTVTVGLRDYGPYLGIAKIPQLEGVSYSPWERMSRDILDGLPRIGAQIREAEGEPHVLAVEKQVYDPQLTKDLGAAVRKRIREDSRTDGNRVLRGLRTSPYAYNDVQYLTTVVPLHIYRFAVEGTVDVVLVDGCFGEVWTSFRAKPAPPPPPPPEPVPQAVRQPMRASRPQTVPPRRAWPWLLGILVLLAGIAAFQAKLLKLSTTFAPPPAEQPWGENVPMPIEVAWPETPDRWSSYHYGLPLDARVTLSFVIDGTGTPRNVKLERFQATSRRLGPRSPPDSEIQSEWTESARRALSRWRFNPQRRGNQVAERPATVDFDFNGATFAVTASIDGTPMPASPEDEGE